MEEILYGIVSGLIVSVLTAVGIYFVSIKKITKRFTEKIEKVLNDQYEKKISTNIFKTESHIIAMDDKNTEIIKNQVSNTHTSINKSIDNIYYRIKNGIDINEYEKENMEGFSELLKGLIKEYESIEKTLNLTQKNIVILDRKNQKLEEENQKLKEENQKLKEENQN